jgi:hypothetical protein
MHASLYYEYGMMLCINNLALFPWSLILLIILIATIVFSYPDQCINNNNNVLAQATVPVIEKETNGTFVHATQTHRISNGV